MKIFEPITTLAKNKVSVGDEFLINNKKQIVCQITNQFIYLDNGKQYIKKMFNEWLRISRAIKIRDEQSNNKNLTSRNREIETIIMRKEAKAIYDEKYRQSAINHMGADTTLKRYIVLTGVGTTIKFYFSPTFKTDFLDLETSYKSLHGVKYVAFACGYYIQHDNNIALIGMQSFLNRNLSDKRKAFALNCLDKECLENKTPVINLYNSINDLLQQNPQEKNELLSSPKKSTEPKHWSGLNGDIATSQIDQQFDNTCREDQQDYPF